MSHKSDPCRDGEHDECDRLVRIAGKVDDVYCSCDCGCDGIGQEALV